LTPEITGQALGSALVSEDQRIFISIASYRDIQLVPTIEDLLAKADEPSLLSFGICWQHHTDEPRLPFEGDPRFQILDVDWPDSRGACWARAKIMELWSSEQWFLQVDSHCRFIQGWDTKLIRMMSQTQSPKAILSTYANAFTPREPGSNSRELLAGPPHLIAIETFNDLGLPILKPVPIPNLASRTRPMAARFLAAGFLFAPGSFVEDVPYDPELYFFGEEISMTIRAFTSGYDLFHPIEDVAWHDYVRAYATRHWDDHVQPAPAAVTKSQPVVEERAWSDLDRISRQKVHRMLCGETQATADNEPSKEADSFGLGTLRTREDYERYAGISFQLRKLQDYTRRALEPPNPPCDADWPARIYTWMVRIPVKVTMLAPVTLDNLTFLVITIQDEESREIRRHDFQRKEMVVENDASEIVLVCEIQSGIIPAFWTAQPFSRSKGWGSKLVEALEESNYSIILDEDEDEHKLNYPG
jgi:Glycosyltransferase (GlcNAc)